MSECTKVKFASEKLALEHIERINKKKGDKVFLAQHTYLCEVCATWHLTKLTQETEHRVTELSQKLSETKVLIKELNNKHEKKAFFLKQEINRLRAENQMLKNTLKEAEAVTK
jgi:hypothetical protein